MSRRTTVALWACMLAVLLCAMVPRAAYAANDIMVGMFYTSDSDYTNSIYLSSDGSTLTRVATTYDTAGRDDWGTSIYRDANGGIHYGNVDPSIMYYNGYFWSLSGWNRQDGKFWPMISYSKDLVNWTHPEGDGLITGTHGVSLNAYPAGYSSSKKDFDTVAPEWFVSKNGSVYIVFSAGYYGAFHGQPTQDRMQAYVVKVSELSAKDPYADGSTKYRWPHDLTFKAGTAKRLKITGNSASNANFIDGAMYTEGTKDYLVIKKDGATNQLFSTSNIDKNKWSLVNSEVSVGYEGASIAKLGSTYYMVGDKLSGTTAVGVGMFTSSSLTAKGRWTSSKVKFVTQAGKACAARHGSIIVLKQGTAGWDVASKLLATPISKGTKVSAIKTQTYTGQAIKPTVTVTRGGKKLKKGVDYTVTYKNNVKAGTAKVVITGKGLYSGTLTKTFTIAKANLSKATITLKKTSYTYTGSAIKATVKSVKVGKTTYKKDTDYTVSYQNNVDAGTASVVVTGKGSCKGTASTTFAITRKSIANATITQKKASYTYTGSAIKSLGSVELGGKTLKSSTDYKATYANNVNAGAATVTVVGKGNYKGSATATFEIARKDATVVVVDAAKTYGEEDPELTAEISGVVGGDELVYEVSRAAGEDVGTYDMCAVGETTQGNYEVTFVDGVFAIERKAATVTAVDTAKQMGEMDPELLATVDGVLEGDDVSYEVHRDAGEEPGAYAIHVTGEETQGNYVLTFVDGTFTITQSDV